MLGLSIKMGAGSRSIFICEAVFLHTVYTVHIQDKSVVRFGNLLSKHKGFPQSIDILQFC